MALAFFSFKSIVQKKPFALTLHRSAVILVTNLHILISCHEQRTHNFRQNHARRIDRLAREPQRQPGNA
jgi:hypothetical protein